MDGNDCVILNNVFIKLNRYVFDGDIFMFFFLGIEFWILVWFLKLCWWCCFVICLVCLLVCGCIYYCKYILVLLCLVYFNFVFRIYFISGYEVFYFERFWLEVWNYWIFSLLSCVVFYGIWKGWKLKIVCWN